MLHLFIADIGSKVSELVPSSIILKIFSKHLTPGEQEKLVLTCFNFENTISSLSLGTKIVNNNLIINSKSVSPTFTSWCHNSD